MKHKGLIIIILIFMAFVFFLQSCVKKETIEITLPEGKTAEIIFLVGDVYVTSEGGDWVRAEIGDALKEGVRIRTEANSYCEIVTSSGTVFRMKDRSELQLVQLPVDENQNKSLIKLVSGDLFAKVQKISYKSRDTVVTSTATLGVRGTEFLVHTENASASGFTEVLVADGTVNVKMNVKLPSEADALSEMRALLKKLEKGVKVRGGFKLEISEEKVADINNSIAGMVKEKVIEGIEINRLKQEALLVPVPLTGNDKKRIEELQTLSLSFKAGRTLYISPNFDGNNDEFSFSAKDFLNERVYGWKMVVSDGKSRVEKIIRHRISDEGNHIALPENITWNMVNDHGRTLRDGDYVYEFYTMDRNKRDNLRVKGRIIVDTEPPLLVISAQETTFSPNEDDVKDTIKIDIETEPGIEWACIITTPDGITVKTVELGTDIPDVFEWDGKGENGAVLPEGVYNITFTGQDRAGNKTTQKIHEISLDIRERSAAVDVNNSIFSPNGDGVLDTMTFYPILSDRSRIDTWDLIVQTVKGDTARRFRGVRYIPETIEWDGILQRGKSHENLSGQLPSGKYYYFLKVIYRSGVNTYSFKKELTLDNDPPVIDVGISPALFSPDGDGENDVLFISPGITDLTPVTSWKATIYTAGGSVFKRFSGINMPGEQIMWDGISDRGRLVGSGDDYTLVFEATDSGYNTGVSEKIPFSVDILVIPTERGLKIQVSNIEFGFDTANLQGEKTFAILERGTEVLRKYEKYSIAVEGHTDSTGNEDYNIQLSKKRAEAVGEYLIKNGIEAERLSYEGYGSEYPIDTNATAEGRARNRRVEFILIRKK